MDGFKLANKSGSAVKWTNEHRNHHVWSSTSVYDEQDAMTETFVFAIRQKSYQHKNLHSSREQSRFLSTRIPSRAFQRVILECFRPLKELSEMKQKLDMTTA